MTKEKGRRRRRRRKKKKKQLILYDAHKSKLEDSIMIIIILNTLFLRVVFVVLFLILRSIRLEKTRTNYDQQQTASFVGLVTAAAFILLALTNINVCGCGISFFYLVLLKKEKERKEEEEEEEKFFFNLLTSLSISLFFWIRTI